MASSKSLLIYKSPSKTGISSIPQARRPSRSTAPHGPSPLRFPESRSCRHGETAMPSELPACCDWNVAAIHLLQGVVEADDARLWNILLSNRSQLETYFAHLG